MTAGALVDSPWPAEDGGAQRLQRAGAGLALQPGETLRATTRTTLMSTMTVLGAPGEVFLLTHSALRSRFGLPTTSRIERIDPVTLRTVAASPRLAGGPMWPGGLAVLGNGDLCVVYGRWAHRLGRDCRPKASLRLPVDGPYNSFVTLACDLIVTKNLSDTVPARLSVIDPETMTEVASATCPEASVARLSALGDTVYVVGVTTIMRFNWRAGALAIDRGWHWDYLAGTANSHGWDAVIDGSDAWFMDNGRHCYRTRMIGAGVAPTANRLLRVSLTDAGDHGATQISGLAGGSIANPPLVDRGRGIVVGYDSANRVMWGWRIAGMVPLWRCDAIGCASHMLLFPGSGEIVTNDFGAGGEWVVVLDIATGAERGRVRVGGLTQGVVFPSPGWDRDVYWCSMGKIARVFVGTGGA